MSRIAQAAIPLTNNLDVILPPSAQCKAIEISNQTPNLILVALAGNFGQFYMSPYTDKYKNVPGYNNGSIMISISATMIGSGQAPLNQFSVISYGTEDPDQADFTISTGLLTNSGNLNSLTSTQSVVNDGNAAGTQVIESTMLGSTGNNLLFTNNGFVTIAEYISSIYTALLQILPGSTVAMKLGALGRTVEVLGNLNVDGILTATNASNDVLATQLQDVANVPGFRLGGNSPGDMIDFTGVNSIIKGGPGGALIFNDQSTGNQWSRSAERHGSSNQASGTGVVINHGMVVNGVATAPDMVLYGTANSVSTTGSIEVYSITTTQFTLIQTSGSSMIIRWLAIKF